jgi:hypothetical protein
VCADFLSDIFARKLRLCVTAVTTAASAFAVTGMSFFMVMIAVGASVFQFSSEIRFRCFVRIPQSRSRIS